jgi:uncharacterized RDD family membrane protein YckC
MALVFCTRCGHRVSTTAQKCPACGTPPFRARVASAASTPVPLAKAVTPRSVRYAGFWRRAVAAMVDGQGLNVSTFLLMLLLGLPLPSIRFRADGTPIFLGSWSGSLVVGGLVGWLYFTLFESSALQATPGKLIFGARVTDLGERRVTFSRANARYCGKFLDVLTFAIGYLMAGWTRKKQALHDKLAETLVVLRPTTLTASVQTLLVVAALVGGGIVSAAVRSSCQTASVSGGASASSGSKSVADATPSHVSGEPAATSSPASAIDPCKELSVDFDAALRNRLASGLSADEAHIYACGDLTRQACLTTGIAAVYSSVPTNPLEAEGRTPEETRLLNEKMEKLTERVSLCQKSHACDVVSCSDLGR